MLATLLVLLTAAHLMSMNIASAGPLLCVWLLWRGKSRESDESLRLAKALAMSSLQLLLIGSLLGLAMGYLAWASGDVRLVEVLPRFRSRVIWGIMELLCSLVWTAGYWAWTS